MEKMLRWTNNGWVLTFGWLLFSCQPKQSHQQSIVLAQKDSVQTKISTIDSGKAPEPVISSESEPPITAESDSLNWLAMECKYTGHIPVKTRRELYPFNKARRMTLISYENTGENEGLPLFVQNYYKQQQSKRKTVIEYKKKQVESDSVQGLYLQSDSMENKEIFFIKDSIQLSQTQIDRLTDLLYNYSYRQKPRYRNLSMCVFTPRHSLIFYNDKDMAFARIDLCFDCRMAVPNSKKINLGVFCTGKWEMLGNLFKNIGIKYGLDKNGVK